MIPMSRTIGATRIRAALKGKHEASILNVHRIYRSELKHAVWENAYLNSKNIGYNETVFITEPRTNVDSVQYSRNLAIKADSMFLSNNIRLDGKIVDLYDDDNIQRAHEAMNSVTPAPSDGREEKYYGIPLKQIKKTYLMLPESIIPSKYHLAFLFSLRLPENMKFNKVVKEGLTLYYPLGTLGRTSTVVEQVTAEHFLLLSHPMTRTNKIPVTLHNEDRIHVKFSPEIGVKPQAHADVVTDNQVSNVTLNRYLSTYNNTEAKYANGQFTPEFMYYVWCKQNMLDHRNNSNFLMIRQEESRDMKFEMIKAYENDSDGVQINRLNCQFLDIPQISIEFLHAMNDHKNYWQPQGHYRTTIYETFPGSGYSWNHTENETINLSLSHHTEGTINKNKGDIVYMNIHNAVYQVKKRTSEEKHDKIQAVAHTMGTIITILESIPFKMIDDGGHLLAMDRFAVEAAKHNHIAVILDYIDAVLDRFLRFSKPVPDGKSGQQIHRTQIRHFQNGTKEHDSFMSALTFIGLILADNTWRVYPELRYNMLKVIQTHTYKDVSFLVVPDRLGMAIGEFSHIDEKALYRALLYIYNYSRAEENIGTFRWHFSLPLVSALTEYKFNRGVTISESLNLHRTQVDDTSSEYKSKYARIDPFGTSQFAKLVNSRGMLTTKSMSVKDQTHVMDQDDYAVIMPQGAGSKKPSRLHQKNAKITCIKCLAPLATRMVRQDMCDRCTFYHHNPDLELNFVTKFKNFNYRRPHMVNHAF